MDYAGAFIGFLGGFALGLLMLNFILKDKSAEDLRSDKDLQLKYGALNWCIAILGAVAGWYVFPLLFGA